MKITVTVSGDSVEELQEVLCALEIVKQKKVEPVQNVYGSIRSLDLPIRVQNALEQEGIKTLDKLICAEPAHLLKIPNFGRLALVEVRASLARLSLGLANDRLPAIRQP